MAENTQIDSSALTSTEGVIRYISSAVRDGNTFYYIELEDSDQVYVASIQTAEILAVLHPGDTVKVSYVPSEDEFVDISEITRRQSRGRRNLTLQG